MCYQNYNKIYFLHVMISSHDKTLILFFFYLFIYAYSNFPSKYLSKIEVEDKKKNII